jgi:FkbM family methyltransferase
MRSASDRGISKWERHNNSAELECSAMDHLCIRVKGGGKICVPAGSVSAYVLLEQEDWFEKEIAFVRRMLRPGMRAIDIGSNYGIYTLAMAQAVGPGGKIWAYEPASATARYLRATIARNDLANVEIIEAALSDRSGTGRLHVHAQTESSHLALGAQGEDVLLTTLDTENSVRQWEAIDFLKIDAEGGERDIIRGGETFFATQSPLVMFERRTVEGENEEAQAAFHARGYTLFKLIGPDRYLVPAGSGEQSDAFELNLFACKPDRAEILSVAELLTAASVASFDVTPKAGLELWRRADFAASFPDARMSVQLDYQRALDAYAVWREGARPLAERWGALRGAADIVRSLTAETQNLPVLSTGARILHEAGMRTLALDCLNRMLGLMKQAPPVLNEPFWPAATRYDAMQPGADRNIWFLAAALEAYEERRAFSSQFAAPDTLAGLDWLAGTRYASPAMERCRQLIAIRAGRQRQRQSTPLLNKASDGHLNPQLWGGRPKTPEAATGPGAGSTA